MFSKTDKLFVLGRFYTCDVAIIVFQEAKIEFVSRQSKVISVPAETPLFVISCGIWNLFLVEWVDWYYSVVFLYKEKIERHHALTSYLDEWADIKTGENLALSTASS